MNGYKPCQQVKTTYLINKHQISDCGVVHHDWHLPHCTVVNWHVVLCGRCQEQEAYILAIMSNKRAPVTGRLQCIQSNIGIFLNCLSLI